MCSASWRAEGTQLMPPSNHPTRSPGWRSRMPPKMYLPNRSRNGATDWSIPMLMALCSFGVDGGLSPMWCATGTCASSTASHTPSIALLAKSMGRFSRSLPGESGMRKVLSPSCFSSFSVRRAPVRVPPVDETYAVDPVARPLLHLGHVFVVDPEAPLTDLSVRPPEQGEDRIREGRAPSRRPPSRAPRAAPRRRRCATRVRGRTG